MRDAVFTELTYHAAYDPQRAIRTERWKYIRFFDDYDRPVLPNVDDSPSKDVFVEAGWGERQVPREQLYDMVLDPEEGNNLAGEPAFEQVRAELASGRARANAGTNDPLLDGPVAAPPGARLNRQDQLSAEEPTYTVGADAVGALAQREARRCADEPTAPAALPETAPCVGRRLGRRVPMERRRNTQPSGRWRRSLRLRDAAGAGRTDGAGPRAVPSSST